MLYIRLLGSLFLLGFGLLANAQTSDSIVIYGEVVSQDSTKRLPNTHVINKSSFAGTITNGLGEFLMRANVGDTIVFSNISYQFYYYTVTGNEENKLTIQLQTRNYLLDEVSITAYKLTSNDPKPMAIGEPMIPRNEDLKTPEALAPTIANPVDFLYYLISRRPKQLEKLRELYQQDYYKRKLQEGNNRDILVELTGLPKEELAAFMFYCKYADTYINTLNDYEYLLSLLSCYEQYEREKAVEQILKEQEVEQQMEFQNQRFKDDD